LTVTLRRIGKFRPAFAARKLHDGDVVFFESFDEGAPVIADGEIPSARGLTAQARLKRLAVRSIEDDDGRANICPDSEIGQDAAPMCRKQLPLSKLISVSKGPWFSNVIATGV
jgi:hypothetical protein